VRVRGANLFCRELGRGLPIVVLHGGPDFDHNYLLPQLDPLADSFRLIYYDQRGRGRSADDVRADEVTIESEVADLDALREHFHLPSIAVLGHSWGAVLAMEYTIRHPERISHMILMNPAPGSSADFESMRHRRHQDWPADMERMRAIAATPGYRSGDVEAEAAYYRIHYGRTVPAALLQPLLDRMRAHFTREGILKARDIETRLMLETWESGTYDLIPALRGLKVPTLVLHGDSDFVPIPCAARIADAVPGSRMVVLDDAGHFSYLEHPIEVCRLIVEFVGST
jgi:proline iminopeptidase